MRPKPLKARANRIRAYVIEIETPADGAEHTAVSVVGVLAEAFVGNEEHMIAIGFAQGSQRLLHDAFILQCR